MNQHPLIKQADDAFSSGNNTLGLDKLRRFSQTDQADAQSWNRLAIVEEQIGEWTNAGIAHFECINSAPYIGISYLYAAYWLEQSKLNDAAASVYSLAQETDARILDFSSFLENPQLARRSRAGNFLLRSYLSNQHRRLFDQANTTSRIAKAIWPQTHDSAIQFGSELFSPQLFYIRGLTEKPYYEVDEFEWAEHLTKHSQTIKNELSAVLSSTTSDAALRPYLSQQFSGEPSLRKLAGSNNWSAMDLYRNGELNDDLSNSFPKTLELIQNLPCYGLDSSPFEVFFSVLKPKQEISKHFGESNHSLTVHLALDIPSDCYLEVAGEKRRWVENELVAFDDSFLHSAHNTSDQRRIVLILSVWHPSLSETEKAAIQLSFKTRQQWMLNRTNKLKSLLPS